MNNLFSRFVFCFKHNICPKTGGTDFLIFEGQNEDRLSNYLDLDASFDDMAIYSTNNPVVYFLTFYLEEIEINEEYIKPDWRMIAHWGMEVSELLSEKGNSKLPVFIKRLPDSVFFWIVQTMSDHKKKMEFILHGPKSIIIENGKTYGEYFAEIQKEKFIKRFGKNAMPIFFKAGPLASFYILEYFENLEESEIEKIKKNKSKILSIRSDDDIRQICRELEITAPNRIMSGGIISRFKRILSEIS